MMTQAEQILAALKRGKRITALYALREFGCFRLAARINDLRKSGHIIDSKPYSYTTEAGEKKTIAQYSIPIYSPDRTKWDYEAGRSSCCGAKIVMTDICDACKEHCGQTELF